MIKTSAEIEKMAESDQKKAFYELHFLNEHLQKIGKRDEILKCSGLTRGIGLSIVLLEDITPSWYEVDHNMQTFKNWSECFHFILGMRHAYKVI